MKYKSPKDFAKKYLEPEVKRGDTLEQILAGKGGCALGGFDLNIGGYAVLMHGSENREDWESIKLKRNEIAVTEFNNKECFEKFKVDDLFNEIVSGEEQETLFSS